VGAGSLTIDLDAAGDRVTLSRPRATNDKRQIGRAVSKASGRSDHGTSVGEGQGHLPGLMRCRGTEAGRCDGHEEKQEQVPVAEGGSGHRRRRRRCSSRSPKAGRGAVEIVGSSRPFSVCDVTDGCTSVRFILIVGFGRALILAQTQWALLGLVGLG
jgi:hypothetical protein